MRVLPNRLLNILFSMVENTKSSSSELLLSKNNVSMEKSSISSFIADFDKRPRKLILPRENILINSTYRGFETLFCKLNQRLVISDAHLVDSFGIFNLIFLISKKISNLINDENEDVITAYQQNKGSTEKYFDFFYYITLF